MNSDEFTFGKLVFQHLHRLQCDDLLAFGADAHVIHGFEFHRNGRFIRPDSSEIFIVPKELIVDFSTID